MVGATQDYKFEGWVAHDKDAVNGKMVWGPYEPKKFEENDVDIQVTHSGICGSDLHTLSSGWGNSKYPLVVGHEIIGRVVRVGSQVKHIQLGDRVGVGAQNDSCLGRKGDCFECSTKQENYCPMRTDTYNGTYLSGDKSYGGYANYHRAPSHFVVKIPEGLDSADAAPMMCGGVTAFAPLKENGCGPGKRIGIVGVGGIGHFGILFAKAMGADEVVGISRRKEKRAEALKIGADRYIATEDDENWAQENARSLDLIVSTISSAKMPLKSYLGLLRTHGKFVQIGAPDDNLPAIHAFDIIPKNVSLGGSLIGSPNVIREMLHLAADKNVKPWIEQRPMKDANQAIVDMEAGKARFRYTLVNEEQL